MHWGHVVKNKELGELYASVVIRFFAVSMIMIFTPLYLYNLNFSIVQIFMFYGCMALSHAFGVFLGGQFSSKYGLKHSMLISIPIMIAYYLLLISLGKIPNLYWLAAILFGISNSIFYIGYHTDFSKSSEVKKRGEQIGFSMILTSISRALGPLIGGVIVVLFGFPTLLLIVCFLLLASVVPLFFSNEIHEQIDFSYKKIFKHKSWRDYLAYLGWGIEGYSRSIVWPLFVFIFIVSSYTVIGSVTTLSLIACTLFIFIVGRVSDINRRTLLTTGVYLNFGIWIIRSLVNAPIQVFVIDTAGGVNRPLITVPSDALSYDKSDGKSHLEYIMFREYSIHLGGLLLCMFMIIFNSLPFGIYIAAGASLLYLLF